MVGRDGSENWQKCIRQALELQPDSLTVYQMELPYNTVISKRILNEGQESPIADWATKRRWVNEAMQAFEADGYRVASATTIATTKKPCKFVYTDGLWKGTDMIALGVSSFGYFDGVHMQNARVQGIHRHCERGAAADYVGALRLTERQKLIREMILQLKTGAIETGYFRDKFGTDVWAEFGDVYRGLMTRRCCTGRTDRSG
jgi:oxygen-independent coproporphyrinogen III oxidase